jgi:hypothetical protein
MCSFVLVERGPNRICGIDEGLNNDVPMELRGCYQGDHESKSNGHPEDSPSIFERSLSEHGGYRA